MGNAAVSPRERLMSAPSDIAKKLLSAVETGDISTAESILSRENLSHESGYETLKIAIKHNQLDMAALLIKHGCKVNGPPGRSDMTTPLMLAAMNDNGPMTRLLLENGAKAAD